MEQYEDINSTYWCDSSEAKSFLQAFVTTPPAEKNVGPISIPDDSPNPVTEEPRKGVNYSKYRIKPEVCAKYRIISVDSEKESMEVSGVEKAESQPGSEIVTSDEPRPIESQDQDENSEC